MWRRLNLSHYGLRDEGFCTLAELIGCDDPCLDEITLAEVERVGQEVNHVDFALARADDS